MARWIWISGLALALAGCGEDSATPSADTSPPDTTAEDTAAADPDGEDAADATEDTAAPTPEWRHEGPIVVSAPATPTGPYFVDVSDAVGLTTIGLGVEGRAIVVDLDGDGRDDIVTLPITVDPPATMSPRVFRNAGPNQDGQIVFEDFTEASGLAGIEAAIMVFADVDNDGDQDLLVGVSFRAAGGEVGIWLNDGTGRFTFAGANGIAGPVIGVAAGGHQVFKEMAAAAFADLDGDGVLDLYIGTWYSGSPTTGGSFLPPADELYRGLGGGLFAPVTLPSQTNPLTLEVEPSLTGVGRAAYGIAVADFDNDGDLDIFVNNYGAGRPAGGSPPRYWDHNLLWRNDGAMNLVDVGADAGVAATMRGIGGVEHESPVVMGGQTMPSPIGGNGFGCQWGDLDNDGRLDLIIGTIAHPDYPQSDRTMLHYNRTEPGGPATFTEESAARGLEYYEDELHPVLVDVDMDGRLDIAMSRLRGGSKWELYLQNDEQTFDMQAWETTGVDVARPATTVWLDYDGDGDLDFFMPKGQGLLFENRVGQDNGWLVIHLVAEAPRDATGARVTLETSVGTQIREVTSGGGHYNAQHTRALHFGLGGDSGAQDVTIRWPDGEVQVLGDVKANYRLRVTQGGTIDVL